MKNNYKVIFAAALCFGVFATFKTDAVAQSTVTVTLTNFVFTPTSVNVVVGDTVAFTWVGSGTHNTQSDSTTGAVTTWRSGNPESNNGKVFKVKILSAGQHRFYCQQHGGAGGVSMSGIINATATSAVQPVSKPASTFTLEQNYPNPFNPATKISFSIPSAQQVTLKVYDLRGREVALLLSRKLNAGSYEVPFNAAQVSSALTSGVYLYRLQAGDKMQTKKMMLLK